MDNRCKFWLPKKKRYCANIPLNNSLFCGNHTPRSDAQWIPCPLDSSHSVLQDNLEGHLKRCPFLKQAETLSLQPYYVKGINAGTEGGNGSESAEDVTSEMKRNAVYKLTLSQFQDLTSKISYLHGLMCKSIEESYEIPEACDKWMKGEVDGKLPFQEKHVVQQASILGNLERFGVLKSSIGSEKCDSNDDDAKDDVTAVVEFGAGRGYLTQILADCYGIRKVFLVERKSYKLKADRSLRQKESLVLERLRIDIEDLNLNAVPSLRALPFLAIGKHLCGPATDLTLRCCLGNQWISGNHDDCTVQGLAVATCCHHLCQWKHYINKKYFMDLGIGKEEFHAMTWFTSWAVDADHGSDLPDIDSSRLQLPSIENEGCNKDVLVVEDFVRNMRASERAILGFMCKQIIDIGRLMWLKDRGLDARLVKYVPSSISPENHLLMARGNITSKE